MKKILLVMTLVISSYASLAQIAKDSASSIKMTFNGGIWTGFSMRGKTAMIGFLGPKLTTTFNIIPTTKIEAGFMGVPGFISEKGVGRLGLAAGFIAILKKDKAKIKPVIGVMFSKNNNIWRTFWGAGIQF